MGNKACPLRLTLADIALAFLGAANHADAQTFSVLYNLASNSGPYGGVVFDSAGNLYGTTSGGGTYSGGTVYELSPQAGGGWTETILHSFNNTLPPVDGCSPFAGLAIDSAGDLYGTTRACGSQGGGTVFELTPGSNGVWTETILHDFSINSSREDGSQPYSTPVLDSAGNLYGTTLEGGAGLEGTVFELERGVRGWQEKVIYSFVPDAEGDGGYLPYAGVTLGTDGNIYGTTSSCTCSFINRGTVFELVRNGGTVVGEKVLHYFYQNTGDGFTPLAPVVFDAKGNLYGTTSVGGSYGYGTVFELSLAANGKWKEKILHDFSDTTADGAFPVANVTFDAHGNIYGTTTQGGTYGYGTVFELSPTGTGTWIETILQNFDEGDGDGPSGSLTFDSLGNLYSTALGGSANDGGNVFEVTP